MKKYTVEYWYLGKHGKDFTEIVVTASNEDEALAKAKGQALRGALDKSFKIINTEQNMDEIKRMQELAGIQKEDNDGGDIWGGIDDQIVYDNLIDSDFEGLISDMMSQAESNPSLTLLDYLKQYGELEDED